MSNIKIGDIVLLDGRSKWNLNGYLIRTVENNGIHPDKEFCPYHVGIVIDTAEDINEVKVLNVYFPKPKIHRLGYWLNNKDANIMVRTYRDFIPDYKVRAMKYYMKKYFKNKVPYDWLSIIGIGLKYFILKKIENKIIRFLIRYIWNDNIQKETWLNCAELIIYVYKSIGVFPISVFPDYAMPIDYLKSKRFRTIYRQFNHNYNKDK